MPWLCVGVYYYYPAVQVRVGAHGLHRDVSWGLYIGQFTFLVGVAASAVMLVIPYYLHDFKKFGKIVILGEFLAISAVIMCILFIIGGHGPAHEDHERIPASHAELDHVLGFGRAVTATCSLISWSAG